MGFFDFLKRNRNQEDWEEDTDAREAFLGEDDIPPMPAAMEEEPPFAESGDLARTIDEVQKSSRPEMRRTMADPFEAVQEGKPALDPSYMSEKVMSFIREHSAEEIQKAADSMANEGMKAFQQKEFARAFELFELGSQLGDAKAQALLGSMYAQGYEAPKDVKTGREWLKRSAAQGNEKAGAMLAKLENLPDPTAKELYAAAEAAENEKFRKHYLHRAAEMGNSIAQYEYGRLLTQSEENEVQKKGVEWVRRAAFGGYAAAMTYLGNAYMEGNIVPQSQNIAREWLEQAAKKGDQEAKAALSKLEPEA